MQEPIGVPLPVPPELEDQMKRSACEFREKLALLLNSHSCENGSDTPDFILAEYMTQCLAAFDAASMARDRWYGRERVGARSIPPQAWPAA